MWFRTVLFAILGFWFGGPFGAIFGALLGAWLDDGSQRPRMVYERYNGTRQRQTQSAFFEATFLVMGRLSKADGRVNEEEIQLATAVMNEMRLNPEQRQMAITLFNRGKDGADLTSTLDHFRQVASGSLIQMFLELQLQAAYADNQLSPKELDMLLDICGRLGVSQVTFKMLHKRFQAQRNFYSQYAHGGQQQGGWQQRTAGRNELREAYATLGVSAEAADRDVKRAYRKLMSEHHPDKLVAKGLPEEMMEMAKKKTQEIQAAYDLVSHHRKKNK